MDSNDKMECIRCGWRGSLRELKDIYIKLQASLVDLEEKACPKCGSITVEEINPRWQYELLFG
jgi:ribosomal protein S27AE